VDYFPVGHIWSRSFFLIFSPMKTKWISIFCLLIGLGCTLAIAQTATDKYWVMFTDKGDISQLKPENFLAERSLARRANQGIALQPSDYPVAAAYVQGVAQTGAQVLYPSKWLNAVSVNMDAATAADVATLPYVLQVKRIPKVRLEMDAAPLVDARGGYSAGFSSTQIQMIGLDMLHKNGYNGHGILISMMDNGFRDVDKNPFLSHLFESNRIVATRDFVNNEDNVYNQGDHGAFTLSILAAWSENNDETGYWFSGSAPGASFILCHTENDASETSQEEDNWVAAMEFADSIGADLFSTSLGYAALDSGGYTYADMDGNTTIITIAADMAAAKGIVVVNSAGNSGGGKMLAPSDGDSVISVGAVNASRNIAGFSSQGPSYDDRVKPDISAMGEGCSFIRTSGQLSQGNGTSFSCPVAAGMAACLLQSVPGTRNMDLYDALIRASDRYENPDSFYGYGIPYAPEAYRLLTGDSLPGVPRMITLMRDSIEVYPNPAMDQFSVAIDNGVLPWAGTLELTDMSGRVVWTRAIEVASFYNVFRFSRAADYAFLHSGRYLLRVRNDAGEVLHSAKLSLLTQR
jgi:serine protease AprX